MEEKNKEMIEKWRVLAMLDYLEKHLDTTGITQLKTAINSYKNFIKTLHEQSNENNNEKKLKGYQYDSLIYRYIRAREQMAEYEYLRDKQSNVSNHTEWTVYRQRANRDIMRFVQILDEVIGEHE